MSKRIILLAIVFTLFMFQGVMMASSLEFDSKSNVELDKKWTIKFNREVDVSTINSNNIYVLDSKGYNLYLNTEINNDKMSATIFPPTRGYYSSDTYTIIISNRVKDNNGVPLKEETKMEFTTKASETIGGKIIEEIKGLENNFHQDEISQSEFVKKLEEILNKYEDNISVINDDDRYRIVDMVREISEIGRMKLTGIIYSFTDGVKIGWADKDSWEFSSYFSSMFQNKIYLSKDNLETLVSVSTKSFKTNSEVKPGGLLGANFYGPYFQQRKIYYDINDLFSDYYIENFLVNRINKKELVIKDIPLVSKYTINYGLYPYSIEDVKSILDLDFSYEYDSQSGILTFNFPFESITETIPY